MSLASNAILEYWFSSLDDNSLLDQNSEPFRTCYARWYGKQPGIDAEIRQRFEPTLEQVAGQGASWDSIIAQWRDEPLGLLALTLLLDQLPRNMYRDTAQMYRHDPLALIVADQALRAYETAPLTLTQRMFLYVPLMHVENVTLQQRMLHYFERLQERARTQSPRNVGFFEFAVGYARRHLEVVARFGRFPHRNDILGRASSADEVEFLKRDDSRF